MDKQLADRKAKQDASFEKEQAEKEEAEQKAKEAQKEQGSNVVEGSMREATRRRDDSLVAENDAGDGTMSDAMTPEEKKYNDMKSTYVLGTEADARAYIDANYPEEQREAMHKLLDAEKEKWHDNEKTPEGRAANKALKKDYAAQRTDTGSSASDNGKNNVTIKPNGDIQVGGEHVFQENLPTKQGQKYGCNFSSEMMELSSVTGQDLNQTEAYNNALKNGIIKESGYIKGDCLFFR